MEYGNQVVPPFYSKMSLSIFTSRNYARFRQLGTEQAKHLVENLSLSGGMSAFLNKHPVESIYGKLERESSHALSSILLLAHMEMQIRPTSRPTT